MQEYKKEFVNDLASSGALFFAVNPGATGERERWGKTLKDGRPTPYFVNIGGFNTGSLGHRLGRYFGETALANDLKDDDVLIGPSHKGSALIAATAMYLAMEHKIDLPFFYDHKEEGRFIGFNFHTGTGLMELSKTVVEENSRLENANIVAAPSYESNVLAVATAIMANKMGVKDLGFAYDRYEAKTHGEGTGAETKWVGKTPKEGDKVFVVYNQCYTDLARLDQFKKSIEANGAECVGEGSLGYDIETRVPAGSRLHLLDDVGTSMATKLDMIKLLDPLKLSSILLGVDREQVGPVYGTPGDKSTVILGERGPDAIGNFTEETGIPVNLVLGVREMVDILHTEQIDVKINDEMKPLDEEVKAEFDKYMATYGAVR